MWIMVVLSVACVTTRMNLEPKSADRDPNRPIAGIEVLMQLNILIEITLNLEKAADSPGVRNFPSVWESRQCWAIDPHGEIVRRVGTMADSKRRMVRYRRSPWGSGRSGFRAT